jgi:hypothetical protein
MKISLRRQFCFYGKFQVIQVFQKVTYTSLGELKEAPLENAPPPLNNKRANFRHKHSHSFGGDSSAQLARTPKLTARLIIRQPSEPLYYQQTHRRSKSRDAIIEMQTPRVAKKREKPTEGEESVKTTRSLKIVTYSSVAPEPVEEKKPLKPVKKSHKKSSSGRLL